MKYNITEYDKELLLQNSIDYSYRLFIIDKDMNIIDEIQSVKTVGNYSINSESKIRRTSSFTIYLENSYNHSSIESKIFSWIGYSFQLQIGIYSIRDDAYKWYDCGYYLITEANTAYNSVDNSISTTLSDWYAQLDGTRNGQIGGAPVISIPNVNENGEYVTIKGTVENLIISETNIKSYIIEDIGEFYGIPQNNPNYEEYRKKNPLWNKLPFDLEYDVGCYVGDILDEINNLYPNCQMYFDIYGNFCFNMIPSCENDIIALSDDYLQQVILGDNSETVSYSVTDIKNVTEVFGSTYDVDYYADNCSIDSNVYTLNLENYTSDKYSSGTIVSFKSCAANIKSMMVRINKCSEIPIYYEYTEDFISENTLEKDSVYVIKISYVNSNYVAYYLGQYQPHALCVLVDNLEDKKYTKEYFSKKYNCNEKNVILRVEKNSPFSVQRLGELLDEKVGEEFDNILSDSVAIDNAIYFNKKSSSVNDTVTISTKMMPFLDVNLKVNYRKQQENETHEYIIKNIDNNTNSNISVITLQRFYPLYFN